MMSIDVPKTDRDVHGSMAPVRRSERPLAVIGLIIWAALLSGTCATVALAAPRGPAAPGAPASPSCEKVSVGAIRWDAWHGDDDRVGKAVEDTLGQEKWKNRWPVYQSRDERGIEFNGATREVVESEMTLAKGAGIDYWAFAFEGMDSPMARVLHQYLDSKIAGPRFSLVVHPNRFQGPGGDAFASEVLKLMRDPRFLRSPSGSAPIFLFHTAAMKSDEMDIPAIRRLLDVAGREDGPRPGVIVLAYLPDQAADIVKRGGGEGISSYAWSGRSNGGNFAELSAGVGALWNRQTATGLPVTVLVMSGWDPRPRIERPPPWGAQYGGEYYQPPSHQEFKSHLAKGIEWARTRSNGGCSVLIYAWNEFDEGGWIAPTQHDGDDRLRAVREATGR